MNLHSMRSHLLAIQIAISKIGLINGVATAIFLLGLVSHQWLIPKLNSHSDMRQVILTNVERRLLASPDSSIPRLSVTEEKLADFYNVLGNKDGVEQYVKTSFLLAQDTGLILSQADYKYSFDAHGKFYTYQITLPIKGSYASVRQFCEKFLLAFPFASLDEMTFRRDTIASQMIETRARFTLHVSQKKISRQVVPESTSVGDEP